MGSDIIADMYHKAIIELADLKADNRKLRRDIKEHDEYLARKKIELQKLINSEVKVVSNGV